MFWMRSMEDLGTPEQRARFEAVRRRVFAEMTGATSRKRLSILLPFQLIVLGVLFGYGAPPVRIAVQVVAYFVCNVGFRTIDRTTASRIVVAFSAIMFALFVSLANTGGIRSPLLIGTAPFLFTLAINPVLTRPHRVVFLLCFFFGVLALSLTSNTWATELYPPLAPMGDHSSPAYAIMAGVSAFMTAVAAFKMGRGLSLTYEKVAFEIAIRREELCSESEGRTRALEGIATRLAHEVKNPLAAIKGLSTHVARSAKDEKVTERLTIVAAEAERLQEIVDSFLSFSRGLDDLAVSPVKPYDIARELSLLLETRAADAGVTIEVVGSRELTLHADGKKLRQALLNLVLNAIQASSREATITIEVAKYAGGDAQIKVVDRGTGMNASVLDRIRKPYFTTREGGSGLGIVIARGIIEQHGGNLHFESTEGRGTVVTIVLPAAASAQRPKLPNPCRTVCPSETAAATSATEPSAAPTSCPTS